jgi:hypothetical protein
MITLASAPGTLVPAIARLADAGNDPVRDVIHAFSARGLAALRQVLHERGASFQRTRTWKESADPDRDARLDRIEYVTSACPDRCLAFGQWAAQTTGITPRWPASCRPARAGVMPAPATPACWPPSAVNAPASAANAGNAGAARNLKPHNRAGERSRPAH